YDISYRIELETLEDYFEGLVIEDPQMEMNFDLTIHVQAQDYKPYPVVVLEDGKYILRMMEWGLISKGMTTPELIKERRSTMCNARSERIVIDEESAWYGLRNQRCLIPVNGIFEHRGITDKKKKYPYYIRLKDRPIFCLPGLYNYSPGFGKDKKPVGSFTIITRTANEIMRQIHNDGENAFRMPLFLPKELELKWLQPGLNDLEIQQVLDFEMPSESLEYHTVFRIRGKKEHPTGGLKTDQFMWPDMPPLGVDTSQQSLF
ncbi:MAG: SOS response-associated peptidase family protein, partial [Chitinophagaceae bacterium]|nr:SOS response-associated peptidase family protein [Chitinophagaceae bacterium]